MQDEDSILLHAEGVPLPELEAGRIHSWITGLVEAAGWRLNSLNYIFCDDAYLHDMNVQYLEHDTLTDIITFDNSDREGVLEGDIFISTERVQENAAEFGVTYGEELLRVMAHGVLHLLGYRDKTQDDQAAMRHAEDEAVRAYGPPPDLA